MYRDGLNFHVVKLLGYWFNCQFPPYWFNFWTGWIEINNRENLYLVFIEPFLRGYRLKVHETITLFFLGGVFLNNRRTKAPPSHCGCSNPFLSPPKSCSVPAASECKLRSTLEQFLLLSLWTMFEEEEDWIGHALQEQAYRAALK